MERDHGPDVWAIGWQMVRQQQLMNLRMAEDFWHTCFGMQEHLMKEWLDLLAEHHPHRRKQIDTGGGADLTEHYGHRAHDVDVERI